MQLFQVQFYHTEQSWVFRSFLTRHSVQGEVRWWEHSCEVPRSCLLFILRVLFELFLTPHTPCKDFSFISNVCLFNTLKEKRTEMKRPGITLLYVVCSLGYLFEVCVPGLLFFPCVCICTYALFQFKINDPVALLPASVIQHYTTGMFSFISESECVCVCARALYVQ